ncbi:hypothetical protein Syun_023357 [Stephania yunnanensis]|uniref:Cyclic nucleotide-binding domain-containing protein n=1 Tax=Stephania yunnanensis TaxID=152371 RepID=A0AAP0F8V5_9MAGN
MLKFNHYNPNEYVVRNGETGDAIYFIWDREAAVNEAQYEEENRLETMFPLFLTTSVQVLWLMGRLYAGVITVEGITDVLEVPSSILVEGIIVVQDTANFLME